MSTQTTLFLSKKGLRDLELRIAKLQPTIADLRKELRESDAPDTRDERLHKVEQLAQLDKLETELEAALDQQAHAKLLPRKRDRFKVALGSVVELVDQQGRIMRYTIVSSLEANPLEGRISELSPLGKNLLGKTVRETVEWTSARLQKRQLQLVAIC